jgi:carbon-monoxide dehydrogenase medium subunit
MKKIIGRLRRLPEIECLFPKTIGGVLSLLKKYDGKAKVVAGGTDLLPKMKHRERTPKYLIDLNGIRALNFIKYGKKKGLRIGAATTLNEILECSAVGQYYPILIDAVSQMASSQIRNMATIGGNLCNGAPSADTAPALIALGAQLKLVSLRGERTILVEDFFKGPEKTILNRFELVTEIQIPPFCLREFGSYIKHTARRAMDLANVGIAVWCALDTKKDICKDIKISMGAVAPTPMRARKAEAILIGKHSMMI